MSAITKKHWVHASSMVSFTLQRSKKEITLRQLKICQNLIQAGSIGWVSAWSKWASLLVYEYWRAIWNKKATQIKCKQHIPYIYYLIWEKEKHVLNLKWPNDRGIQFYNMSVNFSKNRSTYNCFFSFFLCKHPFIQRSICISRLP